jgi:hypothetical protein
MQKISFEKRKKNKFIRNYEFFFIKFLMNFSLNFINPNILTLRSFPNSYSLKTSNYYQIKMLNNNLNYNNLNYFIIILNFKNKTY